ncbi:MAG TPA: MFS transporter, partial [Gammaproteobacteria bacterium]|nr:MFS transporter [Gammaproteobacteria bacterium]
MSENNTIQTYPSNKRAWYAVIILTIAYIVSFLDRQILALVVQDVKTDLDLSDTQVSLLLGFAFALFYTTMGIPIGRLADKKSRRAIIATGITIWCLMTAACGLARNYTQLFLARVGVGVGEATLSPSGLSMISDYFPAEKRGKALGFFNMGVSVGSGIAFIGGGQIIAYVSDAPPIILPYIGEIFAWQALFLLVGLPGLIVAVLMRTVKEPSRKDKIIIRGQDGQQTDEISVKQTIDFLLARKKT